MAGEAGTGDSVSSPPLTTPIDLPAAGEKPQQAAPLKQ